jgi:hypothetical protein
VIAGAVPLAPYLLSGIAADRFVWSTILSLAVLFAVVSYGAGVVLSTLLQ